MSSNYLSQNNWVMVWSFISMFPNSQNFKFRFEDGRKLTPEQKHTMTRWCEARKMTLRDAMLGGHYDSFLEEPK